MRNGTNKFFVIAVGLFISAPSWACPDLSGNFSCMDSQGKAHDLTIQQQTVEGGSHYTMTSTEEGRVDIWEVTADGKERDIPEGHGLKGAKYTATCDADTSMNLNVTGLLIDDESGAIIGNLKMNMLHTRGPAREIIVVSSGVLETPQHGNFPLDGTMTCTLK